MEISQTVTFSSAPVDYYYDSAFSALAGIAGDKQIIIITDSNIATIYADRFKDLDIIVIPAGEAHKKLETIHNITEQLLELKTYRNSLLVGVGGGMVTDITGFIATTYMRGTRLGFVPTTLLAMVDAAIGGKNGVNFGLQKNLLGTVRQPDFLLYDTSFLNTLAEEEWSNGFAEIIKYACIFDDTLFGELAQNDIGYYRQNPDALSRLIKTCANWKNKTVQEDEHEKGLRKLLNFGHTVGHAVETVYELPHGSAVAIGMLIACRISEQANNLGVDANPQLYDILQLYNLPVTLPVDSGKLMQVLVMDKKKTAGDSIDFIVLEEIGKAAIKSVHFDMIAQAIKAFSDAGDH